jgi:hypothetical protein
MILKTNASRRAFLRNVGLGAAGSLFLPMLSRTAHAQAAPPRRFVFIVEGNCYEPVTVLCDAARAAIDATLSSPLGTSRWWHRDYTHEGSPLIVEASDFATAPALGNVVGQPGDTDLSPYTAVLYGLSSKIIGGGHSGNHGVLSSTRSSAAAPGGITIDAHLAALPEVRGLAPFDAVRLGVNGSDTKPLDYGTCAYDTGRSAALILQPTSAFNALFGSVASAAGQAAFNERSTLLDFAHADVTAVLSTFSGNSRERAKLESYLTALEEVSARQQRLLMMESDSALLSTNMPEDPATNPLYAGGPLNRFRAQLELATAALKGELTNVVVVGSGTGGDFGMTYSEVINVGRHDLHHQSAGNPTYLNAIHEVTRLQLDAIATMARTLADTPEPAGSGSMLEHTVICFISDNGEQHHSTASDFPVVLFGGSALGLTTGGRTIVYPGLGAGGHRQVSNLLNTFGYCAGEELDTFGKEGASRIAPGPLSELFG